MTISFVISSAASRSREIYQEQDRSLQAYFKLETGLVARCPPWQSLFLKDSAIPQSSESRAGDSDEEGILSYLFTPIKFEKFLSNFSFASSI